MEDKTGSCPKHCRSSVKLPEDRHDYS